MRTKRDAIIVVVIASVLAIAFSVSWVVLVFG